MVFALITDLIPPPAQTVPLMLIGGSFDPIHAGHLWMAERLAQHAPTAEIAFLPTAGNPFKQTQTSPRHRLALLRHALRDRPFGINTHEIFATPPTYTLDTLRQIRQQIGRQRPLIFVLGQDSLASLPRWKGGLALLELTHLWVFARPDPSSVAVYPPAPDWTIPYLSHQPHALQQQAHGLIYLDPDAPPSISSSQIRQNIHLHRPLVPKRIWTYNQQAHLYGFSKPDDF